MARASDYFTAVPKLHNCAQSVAAANGASQEQLAALASFGGGRAPEGLCGALYSAMMLAGAAKGDMLRKAFATELGADTCRALKAAGVPCLKCVETAERLLRSQPGN